MIFTDARGGTRTFSELVSDARPVPTLVLRVQAAWCGTCQWHASWTQDRTADRGRAAGLAFLRTHEFSAFGAFSDAPRELPRVSDGPWANGAFRTPGLRGVPFTMPYGHGGGFGGLRSVIEAHRNGGLSPSSPYAIGEAEPWPQGFAPELVPAIQSFLLTLKADLVQPRPPRAVQP